MCYVRTTAQLELKSVIHRIHRRGYGVLKDKDVVTPAPPSWYQSRKANRAKFSPEYDWDWTMEIITLNTSTKNKVTSCLL